MLFNVLYKIAGGHLHTITIEAPEDFPLVGDFSALKEYISNLHEFGSIRPGEVIIELHKIAEVVPMKNFNAGGDEGILPPNYTLGDRLRKNLAEARAAAAVFGTPNHPDYPDLMPTPNNTVRMEKGSIEWLMEFIESNFDAYEGTALFTKKGEGYKNGWKDCKALALELLREFIS